MTIFIEDVPLLAEYWTNYKKHFIEVINITQPDGYHEIYSRVYIKRYDSFRRIVLKYIIHDKLILVIVPTYVASSGNFKYYVRFDGSAKLRLSLKQKYKFLYETFKHINYHCNVR